MQQKEEIYKLAQLCGTCMALINCEVPSLYSSYRTFYAWRKRFCNKNRCSKH